jgi:hypothetical protein
MLKRLLASFKTNFFPDEIALLKRQTEQKNPLLMDTFGEREVNAKTWCISEMYAPGNSHDSKSIYKLYNAVILNGLLVLKMRQVRTWDFLCVSTGAEIITKKSYGKGIYTWVVKTSSSEYRGTGDYISGSITSFGLRSRNNTEVKFEIEGPDRYKYTRLIATKSQYDSSNFKMVSHPQSTPAPHEEFHTYKILWSDKGISFYRNDTLLGSTADIGLDGDSQIFINHWGSNSIIRGGNCTLDTPRYVLVKEVSFTPL